MNRKAFYKIVLLIIAIFACLFLLEKAFNFGIKHNLNSKASYVSAHKINANVLVLGPCEPLWMVSPVIITKKTKLNCYNIANSHSDFADNYLHLYLYLKNNKTPNYLLLFVTPESFDTNYNTFYSYRFSAFLKDTVVANTVKACDAGYYCYSSFPFIKYGYYGHQTFFTALQGWKHYLTNKTQPYYPDGFEPPAKIVWDNHYENLKKLYPLGYHFNWNALREVYLTEILALCKEKGIKAILYESPVLKETADFQDNRALFINKINFIAKNNQVPFISFQNLSWAGNRKCFVSPMVTTLQGSYLFSDTLGGYLKQIIIK